VLLLIALTLALVVKTYFVQAFWIPTGSMQNTLAINDRVLVNKMVYHVRGVDRGDIVVFTGQGSWDPEASPPPSDPIVRFFDAVGGVVGISHGQADIYIKRVIGLPGDHVACCNAEGQVTVNGVPLSESSYLYPGNPPSQQRFRMTVPAGALWVMGDHRDISSDSRWHMGDPGGGTIPESAVIGRAFVVIWPPSQWGFLNIPATFEQPQLTSSAAAAGGSPAALAAALRSGTPTVQQAWSPLPLAIGGTGAVPLTWLQRRVRLRLRRRRR
jgi:signal peptidase I